MARQILQQVYIDGGIAQWWSIRLQIERSPVQIRLPPQFLFILIFLFFIEAVLERITAKSISLSLPFFEN